MVSVLYTYMGLTTQNFEQKGLMGLTGGENG